MFNFIFEGKIGDILAPVVPSNQLFLAIQHHRNSEIQSLMSLNSYDVNEKLLLLEGGYGAIHVACRYNNKYALDLILSKGISVDFSDQKGSTPLHYASKYGNLDICKTLIEKGASVLKKNKQLQTAYDVSEGHDNIRQFLLPLLLQAERLSNNDNSDSMQPNYGGLINSSVPMTPMTTATMPPQYSLQQPPVNNAQVGYLHQGAAYQPPVTPTSSIGIVPSYGQTPLGGSNKVSGPSRVIQPDGFHSSASDPELQAKYGHTKETLNIAPPPTAISFTPVPAAAPLPMSMPPAYSYGSQNSSVYNRYVPYDAHNNTAAPIPVYSSAPIVPNNVNNNVAFPPPSVTLFSPDKNRNQLNSQPLIDPSPPRANNLLANKSVPLPTDLFNTSASIISESNNSGKTNSQNPSNAPLLNVFNPSTDKSLEVNVNSSSSSVL